MCTVSSNANIEQSKMYVLKKNNLSTVQRHDISENDYVSLPMLSCINISSV